MIGSFNKLFSIGFIKCSSYRIQIAAIALDTFCSLIINMIRRLFSTYLEHPNVEFILSSNQHLTGSFKIESLSSLNWLYNVAPCFQVRGDKISVIHEPKIFYDTILSKMKSAENRIVLASLYLGIGKLERQLVSAMHKNLKENSKLKIDILLDFTRGTRGLENSQTSLMPLIKESSNCCVSLYHTPALRGLTKRLAPPRWNELLGLQHMKLYLFDDTVIISGANLSNDYFTNRQDRYIMIEDKNLADFYSNLIGKVQEFSFKVKPNSEIVLHPKWKHLPHESEKNDFVSQARQRMSNYFDTVIEKQNHITNDVKADTWIFPLIEMGQLDIHHDSVVTKNLISSTLEDSSMKLATGYFNLTQKYMDTLATECLADCKILMAHPNANGFQGAKGPAGGIPAAYSLLAKKFYDRLVKEGQDHRISLYEFEKLGWSYHAKGLWYYLPDSKLPNLTLIGSSNYGERSVNRDLESQICLVTVNKSLQTRLQNECDNLFKLGRMAEADITSRPIPRWVKTVVWLFKNYF